jgi:hypothetical protein
MDRARIWERHGNKNYQKRLSIMSGRRHLGCSDTEANITEGSGSKCTAGLAHTTDTEVLEMQH